MAAFNLPTPPDYEAEQEAINRRRLMADALAKQSLQPAQGQMVSGHYVGPNLLTGIIGPALQAFLANKGQKDADTQKQALGQRYRTDLASGMKSYLDRREGAPGQTLSDGQAGALMHNDVDPGPLAEPVAADPRGAAVGALTSGLKPLEALGQMDLQGMLKSKTDTPETFGTPTPMRDSMGKMVTVLVGNRGTIKPVEGFSPKPDIMNVGNNVIDKADPAKPLANYDEQFDTPFQRGGDWYQRNKTTGREVKLDNAPKTTVTVDTGQKAGLAFGEGLGKKRAEVIAKSYDDALSATKAIDALGAAKNDFEAGIKTGIAANVGLALAKVGKALNMGEVDPTIANTEAFRSNMARQTLDLVKSLGAGTAISNADREFAEKAAGGSITLDDQTMLRLMDVAQATAANTVLQHKNLLMRNADASGGLPEDLSSFVVPLNFNASERIDLNPSTMRFSAKPLGAPSGQNPGANPSRRSGDQPMSLDDYLKSKGG